MVDSQRFVSNQTGYDLWSKIYDTYPNPTVATDEKHFPPLWAELKGRRVLEVGCGTGRHTAKLAAQGNQVVALDLSEGMLAIARQKINDPSVQFVQADILTYEAAAAFDAVVICLVLEHVKELGLFFKKLASLVRPDACIYISEIHPEKARRGSLAHFKDPHSDADIRLDSHAHAEGVLEQAAQAAGFRLESSSAICGEPWLSTVNPQWERYLGVSLLKLWVLTRQPLESKA